jgi:hypothetical protein
MLVTDKKPYPWDKYLKEMAAWKEKYGDNYIINKPGLPNWLKPKKVKGEKK